MTTFAPAVAEAPAAGNAQESGAATVFDAEEFNTLCEMIGEDGVLEMVAIFDTETRHRLRRLTCGDQDSPPWCAKCTP